MSWQNAMGWREILTRILGAFPVEQNVTPDWLRNPDTKRLLKLDLYYGDLGIAIRFLGLQGQRKVRKSDEEELEDARRDEIREELCRQNNVRLLTIDLVAAQPKGVFDDLSRGLATASRVIAQSGRPQKEKEKLMPALAQAKQALERVRPQIKRADDVAAYADAWRDREEASVIEAQMAARVNEGTFKSGKIVATAFKPGTEVQHDRFGRGTITASQPDGNDMALTILFVTAGERKFLLSLVSDKLKFV